LSAHLIQSRGDLSERAHFGGFHQFVEHIIAKGGNSLQGMQPWPDFGPAKLM
jgi:hypothetical protein